MLFILALITLVRVEATEFVVDTRSPAAADSNEGTPAKPLRTISAAAAKVKAGDHVTIHGGDYRETVIITASGTVKDPIIFEAAPGEMPVIKGSDLLNGWQRDQGQIWKVKLPTLPPHGADGKDAAFWNTNDIRQIFSRDGMLLDAQRLSRVAERAAMEDGTFFCDKEAAILYAWLPDSISPLDHPPEVARRGAWLCVYGSYVTVRGVAMRHSSTTAFATWPACNIYGDHNSIDRCIISWGDFAGVSLSGNGNTISRSTIACHGGCGLGGTGEGHVIENCHVLFNNVDRYDPSWHAGGAKLIPNFGHGSILHNEFAHNLGPGLWLDGSCDENVIDGNYSHDNEGAGIMVEISTGNVVVNNVAVSNRNFLSGMYRDATGKEALILHSEQRIAPARRFRLYHAGDGRGIYISSSPNTKVVNNTSYLNEGEGICVEGPTRGELSTRDYTVMNNISVFNHGSQLTLRRAAGEEQSRNLSDYNLLFSVGAVFAKAGWDGPSTFDLKEWQAASGQDQHSLDADPQFAMATMTDFRLPEASPALHAGRRSNAVTHDFFGQARGGDVTSLGPFEMPARNQPSPLMPELLGSAPLAR